MKNLFKNLAFSVFALFPLSALSDCTHCEYRQLSSTFENGNKVFESTGLGYQAQYNPTEDVFSVSNQQGVPCQIDIGIVINAYAADLRPLMILEGQSGNSRFIQLVDLENCSEEGQSMAITEQTTFSADKITVPPDCECEEPEQANCACIDPTIYQILPDCSLQKE